MFHKFEDLNQHMPRISKLFLDTADSYKIGSWCDDAQIILENILINIKSSHSDTIFYVVDDIVWNVEMFDFFDIIQIRKNIDRIIDPVILDNHIENISNESDMNGEMLEILAQKKL